MALGFTRRLPPPLATVYDCMDELSAFCGAAPELVLREAELLLRANVVFTGGPSLYEAKRHQHPSVHSFPSSVDVEHFARARRPLPDPVDQASLPHPRLGFFGVLDERLDTQLLTALADLRSDWQLVLIGPVAKIDQADLPRRPNIHYLGPKPYAELPSYLAGWDVALLPFARNEATRFISPTKTPEYLAAGRPVVSTSIRDVVRPYGERRLVRIANEPAGFAAAVAAALQEDTTQRLGRVDGFLEGLSWERTWSAMDALLSRVVEQRSTPAARVGQAA
jgi:UDP-galactopyranose mutase